MSVHVLSWVLRNSPAKLTDRLVLIALADRANDDGRDCYPSVDRLARDANVSARAVQYSLRRLREQGLIETTYNAGKHGANAYAVLMVDQPPLGTQDLHPAESAPPQNPARIRSDSAPEPSLEPSLERSLPTVEISPARASFDDFWMAYPRHAGKRDASKAWVAAVKRAEPVQIIAGAVRFAADPNREPAFTAYPATWLRRDDWHNDLLPPRARGRPTPTENVIGWMTEGTEHVDDTADRQAIEGGL